ncbi:MAG: hypothetical protein IIB26_02975 [Chloroflexi bacterium]|nr:hypothetical protein [Chloroflexota bacterium]
MNGTIAALGRMGMGRLAAAGLFFAMSVATITIGVTGAIFTDTESVSANTFTTGTLDIATTPTTAAITFSDMAPGDVVTSNLNISNDGSLELRYAMVSTTTEDVLAAALDLTIKVGVTTCTTGGFGTDGTIIYGPLDIGQVAGVNVIGDPAQGSQGGDRVLAGAADEDLCVQVSLPLATGNPSQGVTTTATFDFSAEQTANN